jgi:hypothetical protein
MFGEVIQNYLPAVALLLNEMRCFGTEAHARRDAFFTRRKFNAAFHCMMLEGVV